MRTPNIRRSARAVLALLGAALAGAPAAMATAEIDWGIRNGFRGYVYNGNGAPPIAASAGATCAPNPNVTKGGCDPQIGTSYGVFGWTAVGASYGLPSGAGTITAQGTIHFSYPSHFFALSIADPIVTVAASGQAVVNVRAVLVSTFPGVDPVDARLDFGAYTLSSPVQVTPTMVTWDLGGGVVMNEAAEVLGGFLPAGEALDPMRITLPAVAAGGTPIAARTILLKSHANAEKRRLTVVAAKQPFAVDSLDPTTQGALLRVIGDGFEHAYPLPAEGWTTAYRKGAVKHYTYRDKQRVLGPITQVQIKAGALTVKGQGAGLVHDLAAEPANLIVVLQAAGAHVCAGPGAGSQTKFKAGTLYKSTKNPVPASCPSYAPF